MEKDKSGILENNLEKVKINLRSSTTRLTIGLAIIAHFIVIAIQFVLALIASYILSSVGLFISVNLIFWIIFGVCFAIYLRETVRDLTTEDNDD